MWPLSASSFFTISRSISRNVAGEISRSCAFRIPTKRHMCVPLKWCGRPPYMLKCATVCWMPPHHFKGTHMSRFVEILNAHEREISPDTFRLMLREMVKKLEAESGHIEMSFPYFVSKKAPVSGVASLMDYEVTFVGEIVDGKEIFTLKVQVPVTSLCPCSKRISERGAHNQRSHVTIAARINTFVWIEELIDLAENEASCQLYGLLKRPDEKFVTENAYDNPKFVEDMVRDIAARLNADKRVTGYVVESENFESIHNHSAYAMIAQAMDA